MDIALWIVAGVLALAYLVAGISKLFIPKERITAGGAAGRWVEDFTPGTVKAIGGLELLGAVGLILPAVLGIAPILVPVAALGIALLMVGAAVVRVRRREYRVMTVDLTYLVLAVFVAWGRFFIEPFV